MPTAWIMGATGALGSVTSRAFWSAGWSLGLSGRSVERLERLRENLAASGGRRRDDQAGGSGEQDVWSSEWDVADARALRATLDSWENQHGTPDACLYLAGGYAGKPAGELTADDWGAMLDLNLRGPAIVLSDVFGRMLRAGRTGILVATGAAAGLDASGAKGKLPYAVAKAGLHYLVEGLSVEGAASGIRANALVPGILDTEANRRAMPDADRTKWTSLESASDVLLWLCGNQARAVSGSLLRV